MTNQILETHCLSETKGNSEVIEVNPIHAK